MDFTSMCIMDELVDFYNLSTRRHDNLGISINVHYGEEIYTIMYFHCVITSRDAKFTLSDKKINCISWYNFDKENIMDIMTKLNKGCDCNITSILIDGVKHNFNKYSISYNSESNSINLELLI